jgi:pectin methylesterase-like acyl-CoA thioesterase
MWGAQVSASVYLVDPQGTGDFPTIQAAVDAVVDGDIIELADGSYLGSGNHNVDFCGKSITIRSRNGDPDLCIIDCSGRPGDLRRGFLFVSGESREAVLQDLTIANGIATEA